MRIMFVGSYRNPGGPNEVNRNIISHLPGSVSYQKHTNRFLLRSESLLKIMMCDVVVFSGMMFRPYELSLARLLGKKIIYIMHGCAKFESGESNSAEKQIFRYADRILCVSHTYSEMVKRAFPDIAHKVGVQMNGINWAELTALRQAFDKSGEAKDPRRIILFGGGRTEKKNLYVCKAVQLINESGLYDLHVDVYGYYRDTDDSPLIAAIPCVTFHHVIPHDLVNVELAKSRMFIQNSQFESFGLALIDALSLGCDVLFSTNTGAKDIITARQESDIINDITDVDEIKDKILKTLECPNNKRLYDSIDKEKTSLQAAVDNLMSRCLE